MISILLCAAVLAQEEIPFPVFEKDPWGPFGTGSTVTRQTTTAQAKTEETWTLKSVGKDSKIFTVSKMGQAEQEETVKFVSFTEGLVAPDSGHKLSGKSNRMYTIGGKGVKALLREFTPTRFALNNYRVATADEAPGRLGRDRREGRRRRTAQRRHLHDEVLRAGQGRHADDRLREDRPHRDRNEKEEAEDRRDLLDFRKGPRLPRPRPPQGHARQADDGDGDRRAEVRGEEAVAAANSGPPHTLKNAGPGGRWRDGDAKRSNL